jgi:parvulin-like peptidyl-prolyl isomerase
MRQRLRTGLLAVLAMASTRAVVAQQPAPAGGPAAPAAKAAQPPGPEVLNQTVATVNGQPITRGEVIEFLSQYPVPRGAENEAYQRAVDSIASIKLLDQFLTKQRVAVTPKELDDEVASYERKMKAEESRDLKTVLAESGHDIDWLKKKMVPYLAFNKYLNAVATDANLQKFAEQNKDLFTRAQVKASHIFIGVPPDATSEAKEAAKKKLAAIKAEIDSGKISFADAGNKYSEDDANKGSPNGGDLGYFLRKGAFLDSFSAKAFSMPVNQISEPFETEFGYHLIQVTDRKPGEPFDFAQQKPAVLNQYRMDLQERAISSEKKAAKIEIKPMPADLFPPAPAQPPATGAPAGETPATKAATPSPAAPR